jgi:hypothetical protein
MQFSNAGKSSRKATIAFFILKLAKTVVLYIKLNAIYCRSLKGFFVFALVFTYLHDSTAPMSIDDLLEHLPKRKVPRIEISNKPLSARWFNLATTTTDFAAALWPRTLWVRRSTYRGALESSGSR